MQKRVNMTLDVQFHDRRSTKVGIGRSYKGKRLTLSVAQAWEMHKTGKIEPEASSATKGVVPINVRDKVEQTAWHPKENIIAVARLGALFVYSEKKQRS